MLKIQSYCQFDKVKYFLSKFHLFFSIEICGFVIQYQMVSGSGAVQVQKEMYLIGVILHKVHVKRIRNN